MKFQVILIAALLCAATPAIAQVSANSPAQHQQPGVPAQHPVPAPSALTPATPPSLEQKVDPAKEAAIRHLIDVTEVSKLGDNINAALTDRVRSVMSQTLSADKLPQFMSAFSQKFAAASPSSAVTDAMVPIYARAFTMEEVQEISKFYESPVGKKMVGKLPQVTEESQNTGLQIEGNAMMSVLEGMQDDYPELKARLHPDTPTPGAPGAPGAAPSPGPPQK